MATYQGIDVSVHNGTVDMTKVKAAGKSFVMIRSGYGDVLSYPKQKDSRFESNYKNAKSAGLNIGIYHYMYATTTAGAKREAEGFLATIKGKTPLSMPVALDVEEQAQYKLSQSTLESVIKAFIDTVEAAGYFCMLYSYEAFLSKLSASFRSKYAIWCANISRTPSIGYDIHQYSFTGKVSGVSGSVDLNKTTVDFPKKIEAAGLNGFAKTTTTNTATTEKSVLDSSGFAKGDKSNGVLALKELLRIAISKKIISGNVDENGTFGAGTQNVVNALLKKWGYKENGIAGEKFIKKLYLAIK